MIVVACNTALEESPELINKDPYTAWIIKVEVSDKAQLKAVVVNGNAADGETENVAPAPIFSEAAERRPKGFSDAQTKDAPSATSMELARSKEFVPLTVKVPLETTIPPVVPIMRPGRAGEKA